MLPKINQIVDLSLDGGENFLYKSRIADVSEEYIGIELPIDVESGTVKPMIKETELKVFYATDDHGQYSFNTKVIGIKEEQVIIILLELPKEFQRKQRRSFLRIKACLDTSFKIMYNLNKDWNIVKTTDISGGGIQLILPHYIPIDIEEEIFGWLVLPFKNGTIDHIRYNGKIVRVVIPEEKKVKLISIEFKHISEVMRAKIIRFCYEKQVDVRKRDFEVRGN